MLSVEGADGGERDRLVAEQHRVVVAQEDGGHVADGEDRHADHGAGFDADVRLHFWAGDRRVKGLGVGVSVEDREHESGNAAVRKTQIVFSDFG